MTFKRLIAKYLTSNYKNVNFFTNFKLNTNQLKDRYYEKVIHANAIWISY